MSGNLRRQLETLNSAVGEQLAADARVVKSVEQLRQSHTALLEVLQPRIERASTMLTANTRRTSKQSADELNTLMSERVGRLRALLSLRADVNRLMGLLTEASNVEIAARLGGIEMLLEEPLSRMQEALQAVPEDNDGNAVRIPVQTLMSYAQGGDTVMDMRQAMLGDRPNVASDLEDAMDSAGSMHQQVLDSLKPMIDAAGQHFVQQAESISTGTGDRIEGLVEREVERFLGHVRVA